MSKDVFLSYSSSNGATAETLCRTLEESGVRVWMAGHDIAGGEDFSDKVQQAIKDCACFVMLLTPEAQESSWVPKELDLAIHLKKPVVPVQCEKVELNQSFYFALINMQIVTVPRIAKDNAETKNLIATVQRYVFGTASDGDETLPAEKKKYPLPLLAVGCALLLLIALLLFRLPSDKPVSDGVDDAEETATGEVGETEEKAPEDVPEEKQPGNSLLENLNLPTPSPDENDQIPDVFKGAVDGLKYADALSRANKTKRVKVGEKVSLSTVWTDAVVYSEDTRIAVGDGTLVKGVAPGETYVVIATARNVCSAYYIIVEE